MTNLFTSVCYSPMQHFHAHVYFLPADLMIAQVFAEKASLNSVFHYVKLYEKAVGPHPMAMIELHFGEQASAAAAHWIEVNHQKFSVLIHEDTGDDVKDHSEYIRWIGPSLPIDLGFFELIKSRPDLRVHQ